MTTTDWTGWPLDEPERVDPQVAVLGAAVMALCSHPRFTPGCAACRSRSDAGIAVLMQLVDEALEESRKARRGP